MGISRNGGASAIPLGERRRVGGPLDPYLRVVPEDDPFGGGGVVVRALVEEERVLASYEEAVGEVRGHVELALVLRRERHARPLSERWGADPDVYRDVEDLPRRTETSLPWGWGFWKWRPRSTPWAEYERLSWTKRPGRPASS